MSFITKIFGSKHDRDIKKMEPIVEEINSFFTEYEPLSDEQGESIVAMGECFADVWHNDACPVEIKKRISSVPLVPS